MASRMKTKASPVNGEGSEAQLTSAAPDIVTVPKIEPKIVAIEVEGITPLLVCAWSEKARRMMLEKQMKKATKGREAKDPEADYKASLYTSTEGWTGVPAGGCKGALVAACRQVPGLPMTLAKRLCFVMADGQTLTGQDLVRIHGEHQMHEAMVRLETGVADIRFRAIYPTWSATLTIQFLAHMISAEQIANLVELAGWSEGWCEHRPGAPKSNTGNFGRFRIKRVED